MSAVQLQNVASEEEGMRLDRWFKAHFPDLNHGQLQKLLRSGQVRVNGARAKANLRVLAGQIVRIPPLPEIATGAARTKPEVLTVADRDFARSLVIYQDDYLIAINKPTGLAAQGGTKTERHLDGLLDALRFGAMERPRLVHRLDRDTSGVLLLARARIVAARMSDLFKSREVMKIYWALLSGVPKPREGTIDLPLRKAGRHGDKRARPADQSEPGAQKALTRYRVIDHAGQHYAWVELSPETGRTHQLRAHANAISHPIIGDRKYGGKAAGMSDELDNKLHLHAHCLSLPHPSSAKRLTIQAPLPEHMKRSWAYLGFAEASRDRLSDW